jgi:hypothetical protein
MKKILIFSCLFIGCSSKIDTIVVDNSQQETISQYDYDYYSGYNAALSQFDSGSIESVDLSNKKVIAYTNDSDSNGYADGYHKALDIISFKNNPQCPDIH